MAAKEAAAASISPPQEVYARDGVLAGEVLKLPEKLERCWITVQAQDQDAFVRISVAQAAPAVPDITARSAGASGDEPGLAANGCVHVPAGTERHWNLEECVVAGERDRIYLGHRALVAGGVVRFFKSSGPKGT